MVIESFLLGGMLFTAVNVGIVMIYNKKRVNREKAHITRNVEKTENPLSKVKRRK